MIVDSFTEKIRKRKKVINMERIHNQSPGKRGEVLLLIYPISIFVFVAVYPYLKVNGMYTAIALFECGIITYFLGLLLVGIVYAAKRPRAQRRNTKETRMIRETIHRCLQEKCMTENELLECVRKTFDQKDIFYVTHPQVRECLEEMINSGEIVKKDDFLRLEDVNLAKLSD